MRLQNLKGRLLEILFLFDLVGQVRFLVVKIAALVVIASFEIGRHPQIVSANIVRHGPSGRAIHERDIVNA